MSEHKESFHGGSAEEPYQPTLPKVVCAVIWGLVMGAFLYPFAAQADSTYAADLSAPLILVAKPELRDNVYGASILVVRPLGGDAHVGFIVNRPTRASLGELFPGHDHFQKIVNPVYVGGPLAAEAIFALVQRPDTPGGRSVQILPGLFAVIDEVTLDRIAETDASRARFVAGLVAWRPGKLAAEIEQGAWYVLEPDAGLAMRNPEGLWEELVQRARGMKLAL